jgi:putative tryptophan/tyrosine transport system substrate-binding protein
MIRRREFIAGLGSAAAWPVVARAQQPAVVGFLFNGSPEVGAPSVAAFRKGLSETGYVEGQNVTIEYRWARIERERLPELAADLVRRGVAVIAAQGPAAAHAAKAATTTIPIVFTAAGDPVRLGLVASLNRPSGNITGVSNMNADLTEKRLGLLHDLLPGAARFAVLIDSHSPNAQALAQDAQDAAAAIGMQMEVLNVGNSRDIDVAFATVSQKGVDAIVMTPDSLFDIRLTQILTLAARYAVPVMYASRSHAAGGGLMSYRAVNDDQFRQVGIYTGRILKGEKPADLPVMRPTKFELVINLQTARILGIEVPPQLLATADEVIE